MQEFLWITQEFCGLRLAQPRVFCTIPEAEPPRLISRGGGDDSPTGRVGPCRMRRPGVPPSPTLCAPGFSVIGVNPRQVRDGVQALNGRARTDRGDAEIGAERGRVVPHLRPINITDLTLYLSLAS